MKSRCVRLNLTTFLALWMLLGTMNTVSCFDREDSIIPGFYRDWKDYLLSKRSIMMDKRTSHHPVSDQPKDVMFVLPSEDGDRRMIRDIRQVLGYEPLNVLEEFSAKGEKHPERGVNFLWKTRVGRK